LSSILPLPYGHNLPPYARYHLGYH
jgi:hypothetical protein